MIRKPMYALFMAIVLGIGMVTIFFSQATPTTRPGIQDGLFKLSSPSDRWLPQDPGSRQEVTWQVESVSYSGPLLIELELHDLGIRYGCGVLLVSSEGSPPTFTDQIAGEDVKSSLPMVFHGLSPGEDLIIAFGLERTEPRDRDWDPGVWDNYTGTIYESITLTVRGLDENGRISGMASDHVQIFPEESQDWIYESEGKTETFQLSGLRFEDQYDPCDSEGLI